MGQSYSEVVKRLQAYRRAQSKTQKEMSADMGVTQSHYAKLESGTNVISYDCLRTFESNGGDVYFLITGQRTEPGPLDSYVDQCRTKRGRLQMYRMILWSVGVGLSYGQSEEIKLPESVYKNLNLAQMELDLPENIWKSIRRLDHITQFQMADILGINIKRYIRLEKEVIRPDAEILCRLYSRLFYNPLLVMDASCYPLKECNDAWTAFPGELKRELAALLNLAQELICGSENPVK